MVRDLLTEYFSFSNLSTNTQKLYRQSFVLLLRYSHKTFNEIIEITSEEIAAFRQSRQHLKRTTLNKDLMAFSSFFTWAYNEKFIKSNPMARIQKYRLKKSEKIRENYITHEDALNLIEEPLRPKLTEPRKLQIRDHTILATLYYAGLRVSELCNLQLTDIRPSSLYVKSSKGNRSRLVEIPGKLTKLINSYLHKANPKKYIFEKNMQQLSTNAIRALVSKYAIRCKVYAIGDKTKVTPVTLRHSYATHLTFLGVSPIILGEQMGNPTAVNRYAHPTLAAKKKAADLLEDVND